MFKKILTGIVLTISLTGNLYYYLDKRSAAVVAPVVNFNEFGSNTFSTNLKKLVVTGLEEKWLVCTNIKTGEIQYVNRAYAPDTLTVGNSFFLDENENILNDWKGI